MRREHCYGMFDDASGSKYKKKPSQISQLDLDLDTNIALFKHNDLNISTNPWSLKPLGS